MGIGGACLLALTAASGGPANAQQSAANAGPIEEVQVTGSRLRRDGMSTPTPVTAVASDEMAKMAPTLIMDALSQLPQFRANDLSYTGSIFDTAGENSLNLRGLGTSRTLVLLDGRRVVGSSQRGVADIAVFPQALVRRVEVVTGGASAAYGSDAVSGVANFILDTDYRGVEATLQGGSSDRGDHDNYQFEIAGGADIGERAHIIASADYFTADPVVGFQDRDWFRGWTELAMPAGSVPARIIAEPGCSRGVTFGGIIPSGPLGGTQFIDGVPTALPRGEIVSGSRQIGGGCVNYTQLYGAIRPEEQRHSVFAHATYDFSDNVQGFVQVLKGFHSVESPPAPTGFALPWSTTLFIDNPFLPQSVVQSMTDAGVTSVPFARVFEDLAPSRRVDNDTTSVTIGADAEAGKWSLSSYYQHGENVQHADYSANGELVRTDRFYRALDAAVDPATGRIVCRANIAGIGQTPEQDAATTKLNPFGFVIYADPTSNSECVPLDPFATHMAPEVKEYVTGGVYHKQTVKQDVFELTIQRELAESRGRPISFGTGVAYRQESIFQDAFGEGSDAGERPSDYGVFGEEIGIRGVPAFIKDRGVFYTGNPNNEGPIQGDFDVWEVFAESIVPITKGSANRSLDLHTAVRYADYSGSGGVWAAKLGLDWQANRQVRLRGTVSRDTRAGTLSERFDTQTAGSLIDDPLTPQLEPYIAATTVGGNPNIGPELADTVTFGVVYQSARVEGLSLSVDTYDIAIQDAIDQLEPQDIVDRCFAGAQSLCDLLIRSQGPVPTIVQIYDAFINVAEAHTKGVDVELGYRRPVRMFGGGNESISIRGFANYLGEVSSQLPGEPKLDLAGQRDYPEWLGTGSIEYRNGPFSIYWQTRYIGSSVRDVNWVSGIDIDNNRVESVMYSNLDLSYDFDYGSGDGEAFLYVGNVFDNKPPLTPGAISGTTGGTSYTLGSQFDQLGRVYNAGVRFHF
ncbi:MAG TPA: TonB-dependent receptor [Gammaproteobacteria bacterium]|nr:TonB-dependent receptor [Gammaproteobacteria bacterium]